MSNDITKSQRKKVFKDLPPELRTIVYEYLFAALENALRSKRIMLRTIHQNDPEPCNSAIRTYSIAARAHCQYLQKEKQHLLCILMDARLTACTQQPVPGLIPTTPHACAWDTCSLSLWDIQPPWTTTRKMQELQRITREIMTEVNEYINQTNQIRGILQFLNTLSRNLEYVRP